MIIESSDQVAARIHPSAWLATPTFALLLGQAAAVLPWAAAPQAALFSALPLLLIASRRWRGWALLLWLSLLAGSIGYFRHRQLLQPEFGDHHLRTVAARDGTLYLEGRLRQEPERLSLRSRWQISAQRIWHPTGAEEIDGELLVGLREVRREWRYGDRVRLHVRPQPPQNSGNPGGFNYATYLARREIYAIAFLDNDREVELIGRETGTLRAVIENLRRQIRHFIAVRVAPEHSGLVRALVVGDMGGISNEARNAFTAAGVNHVLSISGLHVAMLGLVVFVLIRYGFSFSSYWLLRWNLLKIATFCSFLAVLFYTALAGAMVPTVRSAIMIGVYELAVLLDREEEAFTSLTLAALLIALVWPGVIADISFQLSFLAVLFIVWGTRRIQDWFTPAKRDELPQERSRIKELLRRSAMHLAVPLLATVGTGPLIAHYFGHLSLAGFIANPLVVPLVGFLLVPVGLTVGFFAVVFPVAAVPFAWLAERLAFLTAWSVDWFAKLPLANISVPAPNPLEIALLYGIILCLFLLRRKWPIVVAAAIGFSFGAADAAYWWRERQHRNQLRVTHLNVGQGDAAVIELPGGTVLLLDAGGVAIGDFDTGEAIVAPFLRSRKILKVDHLLVSHARVDHYGGMRALVREFAPTEFWSGAAKGQTQRFNDLEVELERSKIRRLTLAADQPCRVIERARLCTIFPASVQKDDAPVVLRLDFGKASFLFTSDVDARDEANLLRDRVPLSSVVVKIPRHGNATASSEEFVAAVRAKLAILSAAARSRSEAQREEVVERYRQAGAEVLSTHEDGAIILETDGKTIRFSGYKSGKKGELRL